MTVLSVCLSIPCLNAAEAATVALLPLVINLESISLQTWGVMLVPLTALVLLAVGTVFVLGAVRVRHLLASLRAQQLLFRGAAVIMLGAAGAMLLQHA